MSRRFLGIVVVVMVLSGAACSRAPRYSFPLVQKYTTSPGDLFYFRPSDAQFVLLERRKALAIVVALQSGIHAYSYPDRITVSRPNGDILENTALLENIPPQQALAITNDGRTLAGGDAGGVVTVWDVGSRNAQLQLNEPASVLSLAFSPDGNWLAVGLAKSAAQPADTLWLYDVRGNRAHRSFGRNAVRALAWSTDSLWFAAGLEDGSMLLGDNTTDSEPRRLALSTSPITSLDFHPSALFLASGHTDKRVLLFKVSTGERIYTFEPALPPDPLFPKAIERVAFDGNGNKLAADYAEGEFRIWETSSLVDKSRK